MSEKSCKLAESNDPGRKPRRAPVENLRTNPRNPRKHFTEAELKKSVDIDDDKVVQCCQLLLPCTDVVVNCTIAVARACSARLAAATDGYRLSSGPGQL